jgi:hypothetical protein
MKQFEYAGFPFDADLYGYIKHIWLRGTSTDGHVVCITDMGIFTIKLGRTPKITRRVPANKPKSKAKEKHKPKKNKTDRSEHDSSDNEDKIDIKPWEVNLEHPFIFKGKFLVSFIFPHKLYILPLYNSEKYIDGKIYQLPEESIKYEFVKWNTDRLSMEGKHVDTGEIRYFESVEAVREFPELAGPEQPRDALEIVDMIQDDPDIAIPLMLSSHNFDSEGKKIPPAYPSSSFPYSQALKNVEDKAPDHGLLKAKYLKSQEQKHAAQLTKSTRNSVSLSS